MCQLSPSLFQSMAGVKCNGKTTSFELVHNWVNICYKANMNGAVNFFELVIKFEI